MATQRDIDQLKRERLLFREVLVQTMIRGAERLREMERVINQEQSKYLMQLERERYK